jgi:hypothetical protein
MLVNFRQEELIVPKATVLGVAVETSSALLAEVNDTEAPESKGKKRSGRSVHATSGEGKIEAYLQDTLRHSSYKRAVMEPVLRK